MRSGKKETHKWKAKCEAAQKEAKEANEAKEAAEKEVAALQEVQQNIGEYLAPAKGPSERAPAIGPSQRALAKKLLPQLSSQQFMNL